MSARWMAQAKEAFGKTGGKQRIFGYFEYAVRARNQPRRAIAKAEFSLALYHNMGINQLIDTGK